MSTTTQVLVEKYNKMSVFFDCKRCPVWSYAIVYYLFHILCTCTCFSTYLHLLFIIVVLVPCGGLRRLHVLNFSVAYVFWSFAITELTWVFLKIYIVTDEA